jgi:DNA-binding MarR family transcriptional regulator
VVLRVLFDHESLSLKDIVARVEVDQGSLSRMVDRLIARGWVERVQALDDRRAIAVSLTDAGRNLVPSLAAEADRNELAFFARMKANAKGFWIRFRGCFSKIKATNAALSRHSTTKDP